MATLEKAAIVREIYRRWNAKDLDRVASYMTSDALITVVPFGTTLLYREHEEGWARAFPDGQIDVATVVAQGTVAVAEFTGRGTQMGPLRTRVGELPATGRRAETSFVEILRFRNGKVIEGRLYFDSASLLAQLGISTTAVQQRAPSTAPLQRH